MGKNLVVLLLAIFVLGSGVAVRAQVTTGNISGVVKDTSDAAVSGAKVVILNEDTGISRATDTDDAGRYSATSLSLGKYRVTASHDGFQTEVRTGILLTVGREAVVDLALSVGSVTQSVVIEGEAPTIETSNATVSGLVGGDQIRDLPLNGRSIADLALLSPGVQLTRSGLNSSANGFGQRLSVNGGRAESNLYLIDGTVANNTSGSTSTVSGQSLGVEGVREFRVLTHDFSAEYGRNSGSVVSVVTRSGTNQLHGSVYEFVRNNIFDARRFIDVDTNGNPIPLSAFRRNQFGAAAGGPVKKDKIFFFGNYEGLRQRQGQPVGTTIPDANARQGNIPVGGVLTHQTYAPNPALTVTPYMSLYPATTLISNNGTGTVFFPVAYSTPTSENYAMGRMDFHLSDKDTFYARYIYDYSNDVQPRPMPTLSNTGDVGFNNFAVLSETHIFSPTALNDFRFAFNRTVLASVIVPLQQVDPALSFNPGQPLGNIKFGQGAASLTEVGNADNNPFSFIQNLYQATDTFTLVRGSHSLKFGVDVERTQFNGDRGSNFKGTFTFGSLQGFLMGTPTQLADSVIGPINGLTSSRSRGFRRILFGTFIEDAYRISPRLTVTLGLRYEFYSDPVEVSGKSANLINVTDTSSTVGAPFHTSKKNFAPRAGVAWDPTGSGKTSIRAGAGIFYDQVDGQVWQRLSAQDSRFYFTYTLTNPSFPLAPANPPLATQSESTVEYNLPTPTSIHYNLDIQRQLTPTLSLSLGYVGAYNYNLTRDVQLDTRTPLFSTGAALPNGVVYPVGQIYFSKTNDPVINSNFATIEQMRADAIGNYNAFQASLQKTTSAGLTFGASYTFSKALSQADSAQNRVVDNGVFSTMIANNPGADYGKSSYDQRHILVLTSSYKMPWDHRLNSRLTKAALGGWEVNGIYSYSSGLPETVNVGFNSSLNGDPNSPDRPNIRPGFSTNPTSGTTGPADPSLGTTAAVPQGFACSNIPANQPLHTPALWFNPCAFSLSTPIPPSPATQQTGTYGNLGRNTLTGPTFNVMNFTVVKNTMLTESKRLEFRAEFFNLFNHTNLGVPVLKVFTNTGAHAGNEGSFAAGQDPLAYPNRQIQFGMKLVF